MKPFTAEEIAQWRTFFDTVGWSASRQKMDDDDRARIGRLLPLPGNDAAEPWIFCVHHQYREPTLQCPIILLAFLKSLYLGQIGSQLGNTPELGGVGQRVGGKFDDKAEAVWQTYHRKRDRGEQIMDFCEAFFKRLALA